MKDAIRQLPEAIQRKLLSHVLLAGACIVMIIALSFLSRDIRFVLPFIAMLAFLCYRAFHVFRVAVTNDYIIIAGTCIESDLSPIRKRTKAIYLATEGQTVRVPMQNKLSKYSKGAEMRLYVDKRTPVYEKDGILIIAQYLAVEAKKQ